MTLHDEGNETVTLSREAGLTRAPDPDDWKKWMTVLTRQEQQVYLFLRQHPRERSNLRKLAMEMGDESRMQQWRGTGSLSIATFRAALRRLSQAGLVEVDDDEIE